MPLLEVSKLAREVGELIREENDSFKTEDS